MKKLSDHFNGKYFYNPHVSPKSFWDVLRWMLKRKVKPWPHISINQKKIHPQRTQKGECSVTFINHSTVLLQLDGWNILTDPIWSQRASPFSWIGPKRVGLPGVKFEDLPPIDMVLLSHNHYDHMDIPTLKKLNHRDHPTFFVPQGNLAFLKSKGMQKLYEFDWWDHMPISTDHHLHFVPAQHFSARGLFDRNKTLWGGYVIKSSKKTIYFAGDTGFGSHFQEIQTRLGAPDLSLIPIGAFKPRWFMQPMHLSPEESVRVHLILKSKQSLAIHFGTFQLADEEIHEPVQELQKSLAQYGVPQEEFWALNAGESRILT